MDSHNTGRPGQPARNLAQVYKALAHPVRLTLLQALLQREACVCHLTCLLRRSQPYVSQQLSVLREAGLVADRRDGQIVYYRAAEASIGSLIAQGQQILRDQGQPAELPAVDAGPLVGCHCPQCEATR